MTHHPSPDAERQPLQPVRTFTRFGLLHVRSKIEKNLRDVDFDGADLRTRPAQAGGEGQSRLMLHPQELRRQDGADGARVNPRKTMAANFPIDGTVIQTSAATDAIERLS